MNALDKYAMKQWLTGQLTKVATLHRAELDAFRAAAGIDKVRLTQRSLRESAKAWANGARPHATARGADGELKLLPFFGEIFHKPEAIQQYVNAARKQPLHASLDSLADNARRTTLQRHSMQTELARGDLGAARRSEQTYRSLQAKLRDEAKPFQAAKQELRSMKARYGEPTPQTPPKRGILARLLGIK